MILPPSVGLRQHRGVVLVSAHRPADLAAVAAAVELGAEYVELDVQRCRDGVLVVAHDGWVADGERRVPVDALDHAALLRLSPQTATLEDALAVVSGRARAHLDLKLVSPPELYADPARTWEVEAVRRVVAVLGVGGAVVTTEHLRSVAAVRAWARANGHGGLLVGPSLGADPPGPLWRRGLRLLAELWPTRRLRRCDATLVVAHKTLARLTVARWARRHHLPLLVWTVDDDGELVRWLRSGAWLVTTNRPERALALRPAPPEGRVG